MAFQINFGPGGPIPTPPADLRAKLLALVASVRPGYTATLPGSLIEDVSSTAVGALTINDQAVIDLLNSLVATTANPFLLFQIGNMLGVPLGKASNTSVFVVFTGTPGFVIGKGFLVSDSLFQYAVVDGGIINSDGTTEPLFASATQSGIWSVPAGTVTQAITSVPQGYSVTVVNPSPGIPGNDAQTQASYRAQLLEASLVACQGMYSMLSTLLSKVPGVQRRLINAIPQSGGGWEILVGGGDPYEVAYAIYQSVQDISTLVGSTLNVANITNANPGVVTTDITHGYSIGQNINIAGADPVDYNGDFAVLDVPNQKSFSLGTKFIQRNLLSISWSASEITAVTDGNHGVTEGSTFVLMNNDPAGYNGTYTAIAGTTGDTLVAAKLVDPGSSVTPGALAAGIANVNTTATTPWASGGIVTPNFRNITKNIIDYPNTYAIPFAVPPQQTVTMTITWNTTSPDFVSATAIAQLVNPAMVDYVNSIQQGHPLNEMSMDTVFREAVAPIISPSLISRLVYSVSIDGVGVVPDVGTRLIYGDPQSFLFAQGTGINVVQG